MRKLRHGNSVVDADISNIWCCSARRAPQTSYVDTIAATSAAILRARVVEISKYPATSKARASEAVLSSSVIAVTSTLGLMSMGTGFRSYAGERRQPSFVEECVQLRSGMSKR